MEEKDYYEKLQIMVDKAKDLKLKIDSTLDEEAKSYLHLALESTYTEMRKLIKQRNKKLIN